jgi:hypothetical protein
MSKHVPDYGGPIDDAFGLTLPLDGLARMATTYYVLFLSFPYYYYSSPLMSSVGYNGSVENSNGFCWLHSNVSD